MLSFSRKLLLLTLGTSLSAGCATVSPNEPAPTALCQSPLDGIHVPPRLDAGTRADLVRELSAAPAGAVWVGQLMADSAVVEAVRAAQAVK